VITEVNKEVQKATQSVIEGKCGLYK